MRPEENGMDLEKILTKEKADLIWETILKKLEEDRIVGSAQMIRFAINEAWLASFEEGRRRC
jgi:hypothetical protein